MILKAVTKSTVAEKNAKTDGYLCTNLLLTKVFLFYKLLISLFGWLLKNHIVALQKMLNYDIDTKKKQY